MINVEPTIVAKRTMVAIQEGWPIIANEGGSSSGKTYGAVFDLILLAAFPQIRKDVLKDHWPDLAEKPLRISIVSHSLPHIKRGAYRDFRSNMATLRLWKEDEWRATDFVYTFQDGSYIEFFGLEDESRARGPRRDILFVNEANLTTKMVFDQLAMRTTGPKLFDLNPADFNCWCYEVADQPTTKRLHSTYKDNVQNLAPTQVQYIESYRDLPDDFMWKVYGLGERGAAKELIYTSWKIYTEEPQGGDVFYGLDFGYTNPAALVKVRHYEGAIYAEELLYRSGLTNPSLIDLIKQTEVRRSPIYADCAEPKTIEEFFKAGFNIHPSDKDVWAGIVGVKSYPLFINSNSKNLISELQGYKWKKDKNDNILEEPVKLNDHACDALRYAVFTHLTKPKMTWAAF